MSYKNQVVLTLGPHRTTGIGEFMSSYTPFPSHFPFLSFTLLYPTKFIYSCSFLFYTYLLLYIFLLQFLSVLWFYDIFHFLVKILYNFILCVVRCVVSYVFMSKLCMCCLVHVCASFWIWPFCTVNYFDFCLMDLHSFTPLFFYRLYFYFSSFYLSRGKEYWEYVV